MSPSCPAKPDDAASARALAKTWFGKGEALVAEEMFVEALGAFNCSLRMVEHPATMTNAARAAELAKRGPEALELYRRAEEATPEAEKKAGIEERIAALEAEIEKEKASEPEPEPTPVPAPEAPLSTPSALSDPEPAREAPPAPERSSLVVPGYVSIAVGGAGVAVGAVLAGLAAKAKKDGEGTDSYSEFRDAEDALAGRKAGAVVGFAVGGAALVAGIVLVLVGREREERSADAAVAIEVYPMGEGFSIGGAF